MVVMTYWERYWSGFAMIDLKIGVFFILTRLLRLKNPIYTVI